MIRERPSRPTEAELDILSVLWAEGARTVREVHDRLQTQKPSQYTTTLKMMQIMTKKGLLKRDERNRSHVYSAALTRSEAQKTFLHDIVTRLFGGSAKDLVLRAIQSDEIEQEDLDEIRRMLDLED